MKLVYEGGNKVSSGRGELVIGEWCSGSPSCSGFWGYALRRVSRNDLTYIYVNQSHLPTNSKNTKTVFEYTKRIRAQYCQNYETSHRDIKSFFHSLKKLKDNFNQILIQSLLHTPYLISLIYQQQTKKIYLNNKSNYISLSYPISLIFL